jgi:hypothetical protein
VDALRLACLHRVAHHHDDVSLLWIYDIHLLVQAMEANEFTDFARLAGARSVAALCRHGIRIAQERLATRLPDPASQIWLDTEPSRGREPTAGWLRERRGLDVVCSDLRALPHCRDRLRLLWQLAFPSADYMRERFGLRSRYRLPFAYLARAVHGALRILRPFHREG